MVLRYESLLISLKHVQRPQADIQGAAARYRVEHFPLAADAYPTRMDIHLPHMANGQDVEDWLEQQSSEQLHGTFRVFFPTDFKSSDRKTWRAGTYRTHMYMLLLHRPRRMAFHTAVHHLRSVKRLVLFKAAMMCGRKT